MSHRTVRQEDPMQIATLYVTCADRTQALGIARGVVSERLAACANILDNMTSLYQWDGGMCESQESVLLLKTRQELVDRLTARVRELHSYETPCIVAWSSVGGNTSYFQWVHGETTNA